MFSDKHEYRAKTRPKVLYETAPKAFRSTAYRMMADHLGGIDGVREAVKNVLERGSVTPDVTDWLFGGTHTDIDNPGPLMTCPWWRFFDVVEVAANQRVGECAKWHATNHPWADADDFFQAGHVCDDPDVDVFVEQMNHLLTAHNLGYSLIWQETTNSYDLEMVHPPQHQSLLQAAASSGLSRTTQDDIKDAWKLLGARPPDPRNALTIARRALEAIRKPINDRSNATPPHTPQRKIKESATHLYSVASNWGSHAYKDEAGEATLQDALSVVALVTALAVYADGLDES